MMLFSIMLFSKMTFSVMLYIMMLFSINDIWHNGFSVVLMSFMLSFTFFIVMLSVTMLNVVMPSVWYLVES
jgi:hypothetical protein